jgi:peptide/nickel transport system permease protein
MKIIRGKSKTWDLFIKSTLGKVGLSLLIIFAIMAVLSPIWIAQNPQVYDPLTGKDPNIFGSIPPTMAHPLGTDQLGRDLLSQLLKGSQIAFIVGMTVGLFSTFIGTLIGLISGYYRGKIEIVLMRLTDIVMTLPLLPLLIVISGIFGRKDIRMIVLVLSLAGWTLAARVIRSQTLTLKERPYIESARVSGASNSRIIFKHIAPNILPLTFLYMTIGVTYAILTEAGLGFLGLSDPTISSWGMMLQWCFMSGYTFKALYWMIPPGLCISALALSFYLIGYAMEEIVNPRLRER